MPNNLTLPSAAYDTANQKFGTAALNGGYGYNSGLLTGPPFTIEFWFSAASPPAALQVIMGQYNVYFLGFTTSGFLQLFIGDSTTGTSVDYTGSTNFATGVWHHVALSVQGATSGGILYVDGVSVFTFPGSGWISATPNFAVFGTSLNGSGYFGVKSYGGQGDTYTFAGKVDEVAVWSTQKYTSNFTPPASAYTGSETNLKALWHLDSNGNDSATTGPATLTVAPNNAAIVYSPYNWYANGATEAVAWNFLGYWRTMFTASATCALTFDLSQLASYEAPFIEWRIDSMAWTRVAVAATMNLTIPAPIGTNTNTWHFLEMRVAVTDYTAPRFAANAPARLRFTGIVLDAGASVAAPLKSNLNVLVFGDSITEGMQTITVNGSVPFNSQSNSPQSWASLLRDELGCELGAVGWAGTGYSLGSTDVPAFPTHWNLLATGISRPLTPEPDLVIVNHGTNDDTTDITVAARTVLNAMLAQWLHTRIVVLNPFLQPSGAPTVRPNPNTYLQTATRTCNDPARVTFIGTLGFYDYAKGSSSPDGIHPSRSNTAGFIVKSVANAIRPYLAQRLLQRWTYS